MLEPDQYTGLVLPPCSNRVLGSDTQASEGGLSVWGVHVLLVPTGFSPTQEFFCSLKVSNWSEFPGCTQGAFHYAQACKLLLARMCESYEEAAEWEILSSVKCNVLHGCINRKAQTEFWIQTQNLLAVRHQCYFPHHRVSLNSYWLGNFVADEQAVVSSLPSLLLRCCMHYCTYLFFPTLKLRPCVQISLHWSFLTTYILIWTVIWTTI